MGPTPDHEASAQHGPSRVTVIPGPRLLSGLMVMGSLLVGILYAIHIGEAQGLWALLGVCAACLLLLVLGTVLHFNQIAVEVDDTHLIMRPHPLPLGWTRRIPLDDIGGFMTEVTGTAKNGTPKYALTMLRHSRRPKRIAHFYRDGDLAEQAQQVLSRRLGC